MSEDKEPFLARWARLKRRRTADAALPEATPPEAPAPQLPPVEDLTLESDFKDFMHRKVEDTVRRAALKKLFHDPHFNVHDGLDVYAEDYTKLAELSTEVVERLRAAQRALGREDRESAGTAEAAGATGEGGEPQAQEQAAQPAPAADPDAAREPAAGDADERERTG